MYLFSRPGCSACDALKSTLGPVASPALKALTKMFVVVHVQDPDDFAGGNPCGKVRLSELRCETWGPFVFWCMGDDVPPLHEWLAPFPERLAGYKLDSWVRVLNLSADCEFNWKIIRDNFNESYHLPTIHPELATFINDGLRLRERRRAAGALRGGTGVGHRPHRLSRPHARSPRCRDRSEAPARLIARL